MKQIQNNQKSIEKSKPASAFKKKSPWTESVGTFAKSLCFQTKILTLEYRLKIYRLAYPFYFFNISISGCFFRILF